MATVQVSYQPPVIISNEPSPENDQMQMMAPAVFALIIAVDIAVVILIVYTVWQTTRSSADHKSVNSGPSLKILGPACPDIS